jgi:hypothetical protein
MSVQKRKREMKRAEKAQHKREEKRYKSAAEEGEEETPKNTSGIPTRAELEDMGIFVHPDAVFE